jgi:serine/threonine protein phosphatase PrpC
VATKVTSSLRSDVGRVRDHNEDSAYADPAGRLFIVADGMGGHAAGEVASAMAVEETRGELEKLGADYDRFDAAPGEDARHRLLQQLERAVQHAHRRVIDRGNREPDKHGMGTTVEVLLIAGGEAFVAHVGDSRTYLVRDRVAAQVTTDHTVAEVLMQEGRLTPSDARYSALRTILVNAVGVSPEVGVELSHIRLRRGDMLFLCSDGLHDYFPSATEIGEALCDLGAEAGLEKLVATARDRGGHDNITGIAVTIVEGAPSLEEEIAEARRRSADFEPSRDGAPVEPLGLQPTMPLDAEMPRPPRPDPVASFAAALVGGTLAVDDGHPPPEEKPAEEKAEAEKPADEEKK